MDLAGFVRGRQGQRECLCVRVYAPVPACLGMYERVQAKGSRRVGLLCVLYV